MWTDFQLSCDPPVMRLRIAGEIDLGSNDQLRDLFLCFFLWGCSRVELDLSDISFIDTSCLQVFDKEQRRLAEFGGRLEVVAASPLHLRVSHLAGYRDLQPTDHKTPELRLVHSSSRRSASPAGHAR